MKEKTQQKLLYLVWLFFAAYFLQIFDLPNAVTLLCGAVLCVVMVVMQKRIRIDFGLCLLTITMVSYYLIVNGPEGIKYTILYIPLMIYVLTNYTVCFFKDDNDVNKKVMWLIWALVLGFTIYGILNSYMYYAGYVVPGTRRWEDFWSHEIVPGTQHTVYFLPMLAMFLPTMIFIKASKWKGVLVAVLTMFFCYTSLVTRSRMPLLIFVLTIFVQSILYAVLEWETFKKIFHSRRTWLVLAAFMIAAVLIFLALKDTNVMRAFIANLGKDGGILNNVRFVAQRQAVLQLFDYPMGGRRMDMVLGNFCHNTWLDMANAGGLIPFFAFTAYTAYSLFELSFFVKENAASTEIKLVTVGIYVVFFLYFSVEPALDASIHYLTPWIFINGLLHGLRLNKGKIYE